MKYHEPTKDVGMRRLFRRNGFLVYLADEFRTSKHCYSCGGVNETFVKRESPRPCKCFSCSGKTEEVLGGYPKRCRKGVMVEVSGLLRCTTVECRIVHNRDYNASQNMVKIGECGLNNILRPSYLVRPKKVQQITLPSASVERQEGID